jgi:hypothetical protein
MLTMRFLREDDNILDDEEKIRDNQHLPHTMIACHESNKTTHHCKHAQTSTIHDVIRGFHMLDIRVAITYSRLWVSAPCEDHTQSPPFAALNITRLEEEHSPVFLHTEHDVPLFSHHVIMVHPMM